ncbi:MAG: MobP3 family relaxase [Ruminococcus sp.]
MKWRYIKSGSAKHGTNLVKYIATREGVEKCDESWKHQSATTEQQRLIKQLTEDFPDAVNSFEYQDYINAQTKSTASEFISRTIEENLDLIGKKENYVGYIAMRPRVEKQGAHGLFSQTDRPIDLSAVSKEVAEHEGAVWTTIMSLRREDAQKLGYDNAKAWRDLLRGQANKLAKAMGIPLGDLRWYAAFHNEGSHPHIHLISYSVGKEPYMTEQALQTFKSDFAREIFKNDLYHTYQDMTAHRNELRRIGRDKIAEIVQQINNSAYENETVVTMLRDLSKTLENYKGKTVYGYMPKAAKNLISGVIDELAKDTRIAELYNLWYEQKENVFRTYQDTMPKRIPLSANKEFTPIKNAVIQEALNILHNRITFEEDMRQETETPEETMTYTSETTSKRNPWTDPNDMHCQYIIGRELLDIDSENFDPEEGVRLLTLSAMQGFDVAMYRLGKLYLQGEVVEKNVGEALRWLWKADAKDNPYAQYQLGKLYLKSEDVSANYATAQRMFEKSVRQGNAYAMYSLAKMHLQGTAKYSDIYYAVRLLSEAAKRGNQWAEYQLGKMYLYGQGVDKDYELAVQLLTSSASKGNEYAQHILDNYHPYTHSSSATVLASMRLLARLSQIIRDDAEKRNTNSRTIDRKLMRKIEEKKMAQGQKMG